MIKYNIQFKVNVTSEQFKTLKHFQPTLQCLQAAEVEKVKILIYSTGFNQDWLEVIGDFKVKRNKIIFSYCKALFLP